jgi:hypothetical protein
MEFLSLRVKNLAEGASNALAPVVPVLFSRQVQPAYICLPSLNDERRTQNEEPFFILHSAFKVAARVGLAPTPCGLTNRRATLTPPGNLKLALPAGVAPASIRLEDERLVYFGHGSGLAIGNL